MEVLGPERVLYAMDYPYQQSSDEVAAYDRMQLSPEHKKMLMQENAERVFRIRSASCELTGRSDRRRETLCNAVCITSRSYCGAASSARPLPAVN